MQLTLLGYLEQRNDLLDRLDLHRGITSLRQLGGMPSAIKTLVGEPPPLDEHPPNFLTTNVFRANSL